MSQAKLAKVTPDYICTVAECSRMLQENFEHFREVDERIFGEEISEFSGGCEPTESDVCPVRFNTRKKRKKLSLLRIPQVRRPQDPQVGRCIAGPL